MVEGVIAMGAISRERARCASLFSGAGAGAKKLVNPEPQFVKSG
jgi:hypothetical protein